MGGFRGSDTTLDEEIATIEAIARLRVRRYARDLKDLERDLHELKVERARRRLRAEIPGTTQVPATAATESQ
ncbi:MAG: hypothetical protein L3K06_00880 [Thermoplasmata archaeon]|nr:hypothetical protein [Thermoplasmata archaeon]